jgi:hypothetical protein
MRAQRPGWLEIITVRGRQAVTEAGQKKTYSRDMEGCEMSKLLQDDNGDDETTFYKAAFQSFDWNHSGRIATSVS